MRASWVAAVAAAGIASMAHAGVKEGVDAWQAGNYAKAVGEWQKPAQAGDADAQFNLAQAYKLGRGVPTDLSTAQQWYYKAAVQGHEQAQANLGLILFQNGDRKGAVPWIQKAADRGEPRAQYVLGTALFNGDLIPRDWPRAYALMNRAAAQGLPQAGTSLAQMDQHIPIGQRQQGLALASEMAKATPAAATVKLADAKPVPSPQPTAKPSTPSVPAPAIKPAPAEKPVVASKPAQSATPVAPKLETAKLDTAKADPAKNVTPKPAAVAAAPAPAKVAKPAPAPKAVPAARGQWRVQLGAYSSAASARSAWQGVRVGALSGMQPFIVRAGAVHRLQAGPFASRAAAEKACASAKAAGKACFALRS